MRITLTFLLCSLSTSAARSQVENIPDVADGSGLLPLLLNLLLVLGIIVLLGWFFARTSRFGQQHNGSLDIVATRMVGNRERLVVVQVGEEQVLLGVTAHQITPLHTLREPITNESNPKPLVSGFAAKLNAIRGLQARATQAQS